MPMEEVLAFAVCKVALCEHVSRLWTRFEGIQSGVLSLGAKWEDRRGRLLAVEIQKVGAV